MKIVPMPMVEVHRDVDRSYIEREAKSFFLPSFAVYELVRVRSYCRCPHKWRRPSGFRSNEGLLYAEYNSMHVEGAVKNQKEQKERRKR